MVRRCQSSPEIWAFLRSTYHHEDLITRVTALKKLLLAVLMEHQDISKFLDDWRTLLDNALLSGLLLDDSLQAMFLLVALPTSWRPFITTQALVVGLTVETLIARIHQEDAMRGNSTPTTIPSSQYVQRQSNFRRRPFRHFNNTRNPVNNPTLAKICIHCGRHAHLVHECRTKRREQQRTDRCPRSQLQHIEVPALSQYGMESLQLFTSMLNSTWDLATSIDTSAEWLLDTGATHHMTPTSSWLRDYKTLARHVQVYLGDNHRLHAIGLGNLHVTLPSGAAIIIRDIYHIPGLRRNILSVTAATSSGSSIEFFHDLCVIHFKLPNGQFKIIKLPQQNRLYPIKLTQSGHNTVIASTSIITLYLTKTVSTLMWHYRLGHINGHTLQRMAKNGLCSGLPPNLSSIDLCEGCIMGKASHKPFHRSQSRSSQLNQLVHSDLCGPMESASITGSLYFLTFIDDFSRYTTLYFLKQKSQVLTCFKEYCTLVMCQHDLPVQILWSDNGGENVSNAFQKFCKDAGIQQQYTTPYTPQQNGVSERKNHTLVSAARAMLLTAGLSKPYWEEAVATAGYLQNQIPHAIDPQFTPYYHWFGKIPTLEHLRVFGCSAYPLQAVSLRHKLDATATKMVFVGYGDRLGVKAYRLYDPHHKKFHFARSIYFDESSLISPQQGITSPPQLTHPANPFNSADPTSSTSVPRIEWEEEDVLRYISLPNQPQVPPIQQIPSSPVPIGTPLPPNAPPWSLGRKTKTHLFPNIPHPLPVEPIAASYNPPHIQPSNSTPTSSSTPTNPYVPENPIHQPSLLGPSPASRPSKSSKVRSLKEIHQNSHHSLLMDPSSSSTPIISDCLHEASFPDVAVADALYRQVLQAFSNDDFDSLLLVVETIDEISLDEALSGPEASSWRQAMDSKYQSLMANGTWQLVPALPNRKLVTCKWLLRKKFHADGSVSRYKARLVAQGFTQIPGMDYSETFSPVLCITSFQVLVAIAALFGFLLHQMDVRTAFLNGDLQEEIYMSQPDGGYTSLQHPDYVCRLLKALYGLKQSPRQWYLRFHQCMNSLGYTRFQSDANVCSHHSTNVLLFLAIYVDDILILSNSLYAIDKAKGELQASFSMIDMGTLHYCLGIQVLQNPSKGLIRISQQTYIQSLLTKFNMSSCKGVETPLPTSLKLKQLDSTLTASTETQSFPFANILGGIRYLVTCTRPDICFATNLLSRYMKAPSLQHIQHLKLLMRYLQHTKDYGICFYATHPLPTPFLFGYSDADWGGDQETLQSTSGFVYLLARGSISWQSKKQDRVTLSSTEAKYVAMTLALKEGIWLKHLLMETTLFTNQPLQLLCDNMSAIMLARNLKHSEKTKHIAMKLQFIMELIQEGTIELTHVRSDQRDVLLDGLKTIEKGKVAHKTLCQVGDRIKKTTSWEGLIDFAFVYAHLVKAHAQDGLVEEKRKRDEDMPSPSKRVTRASDKREIEANSTPKVAMEGAAKNKKVGKPRGLAYKLTSKFEMTIDL
ncbi:hypothetical protein L7F22_067485 [Adiantum nelumboides]|nr:hypothetical protein [Adiantum nelumboides]